MTTSAAAPDPHGARDNLIAAPSQTVTAIAMPAATPDPDGARDDDVMDTGMADNDGATDHSVPPPVHHAPGHVLSLPADSSHDDAAADVNTDTGKERPSETPATAINTRERMSTRQRKATTKAEESAHLDVDAEVDSRPAVAKKKRKRTGAAQRKKGSTTAPDENADAVVDPEVDDGPAVAKKKKTGGARKKKGLTAALDENAVLGKGRKTTRKTKDSVNEMPCGDETVPLSSNAVNLGTPANPPDEQVGSI